MKRKSKINIKPFGAPFLISVILSLVVFSISFVISDTSFYKSVENVFQKYFFTKQNSSKSGSLDSIYYYSPYLTKFVLIEIDEKTLQDLKTKWPIPRSYHAKLIEKLRKAGAQLICFDILFAEKSTPGEDDALAREIQLTPNLLLPYHLSVLNFNKMESDAAKQPCEIIYPYKLFFDSLGTQTADKFKKLGFVSTDLDVDGLIRSILLVRPYQNDLLTSFDLKILLNILNAQPQEVKIDPAKKTLSVKGKTIPINSNYAMNLNFGFTPQNKALLETYSLSDVLNATGEDLKYFKDRVAIIGVSATAGYDIKYFPVGAMPGMYGHVNALLTVLENKFVKELPPVKQLYWILFWGLIVGILSSFLKPRYSIFMLILASMITIWLSFRIFAKNGIFMPLTATMFNIILTFISVSLYQYQQEQHAKKKITAMFREFAPLPPDFLEDVIAEKTGSAQLGGEKVIVSVLFSDIRGYTNLSEKLDPVEVMNMLNEYHSEMGAVFEKNGGVVFDYQGDAQMVVFGLIKPSVENHAFYATKAGLEMQAGLDKLLDKWGERHAFEVGVGVCTGPVSLGVVGSAQRKQYAAIGDSTNVASRLQGMSKQLQSPVLISEPTYQMAKDKIITDKLEPVALKGKSEPLQVYRAKGIK